MLTNKWIIYNTKSIFKTLNSCFLASISATLKSLHHSNSIPNPLDVIFEIIHIK